LNASQDLVHQGLKHPIEEQKAMREKGYYYITEHLLFPGRSRVGIHVYFSGCGMNDETFPAKKSFPEMSKVVDD